MMDQQQQLIDWISHDKNFTEIFNILDRYHLTSTTTIPANHTNIT